MSFVLPLGHMLCAVVLSATSVPAQIVIEDDPNPVEIPCAALADTPETAAVDTVEPSLRNEHKELLDHLAVQAALREGIRLVNAKSYAEAIKRLEPFIAKAGANDSFLETLEAAYRGQIAQLIIHRDKEGASLFLERLRVLSPEAEPMEETIGDVAGKMAAVVIATNIASASSSTDQKLIPVNLAADSAVSHEESVNLVSVPAVKPSFREARAQMEDRSEPVLPAASAKLIAAVAAIETTDEIESAEPVSTVAEPEPKSDNPLAVAEKLFREKKYVDALPLYEKAYESDPVAVQAGRERWGYCLLYVSVERYNNLIQKNPIPETSWKDLESDVRLARRLAPSLEYTETVLQAIVARRQSLTPASAQANATNPAAPANLDRYPGGTIQSSPSRSLVHLPGRSQSWSVAETKNFRIYHRDPALAEKVGQLAEEARDFAHNKWFPGEPLENWNPICEIYLYPTAHEYGQATGVGPQSPGHSKVQQDQGRVVSRNLALRTDDPNMLEAVLPHETAHVVFAGRFGTHAVPRWADEGMAVLTEPRSKQEGHLVNLFRARQTANGFSCTEILTMQDYPPGGRMRDFYAHSVGICRYLVETGGSQKLVEFLRSALQQNNYDVAMQQVYGMSLTDFEQQFNQYVATLETGSNPVTTAALR